MASVNARLGVASKLIFYPETTYGSDPGSPVGYVLPVRDRVQFGSNDNLIKAPYYDGTRLPDSVINGNITAEGDVPLGLEFTTIGHLLKTFFGSGGYAHVASTLVHHFIIPTDGTLPGSAQLQSSFTDGTDQFIRDKGVRVRNFRFQYATEGVSQVDVGFMGGGDSAQTDLAGTVTNNGYTAGSYFNGQAKLAGTALVGMTRFSLDLMTLLTRLDVAFNAGIAGAVTAGKVNAEGDVELIFGNGGSGPESDLTFLNYAVNQNSVALECMWANAAFSGGAATKWLRIEIPKVRFSRTSPRVGGEQAITASQRWQMEPSSAEIAARYFGPTKGTYNVTVASNDKLGIKVDGGGTQTITLTAGTAQTATQVVADINATLTGATADVYNGHVRISSDTTGSSSSIQIDTGVAQTGHALFGFDGTARTGYATCPILIELVNAQTTDY